MDDIAIELKGITKEYVFNDAKLLSGITKWKNECKTKVLDNIDLTVKKGEVIALIGRNGCGKTTLMKIIAGMTDQSSGTVKVNGKMVCIIESGTLFINDESGRSNIIYRGMLYGLSKAEVKSKMDDIIRYSELGEAAEKPVRTYSLGMRSRLGFSIMAHVDADIYVIDEALNAGDSIFSGKAMKFINQLSKAGKTVLITSHSGTILRDVSTRALLIEDGKIVADASFPEVNARYRRSMLTSIKTMEEAAASDNPSVEYVLAKIRQASNPKEYETLLKNAAEGRNKEAMVEYGDILYDRGGISSAMEYYDAAAKVGDEGAKARYAMARVKPDSSVIVNILKEYAEHGDHFDEYRFGMIAKELAVGTSLRQYAYGILEKSYTNGNLDAGYEIALMKIIGNGTCLDMDGAIQILSDNALKGHMKSAKRLYALYSDGTFIDPDIKEAFKWCELAAKMGDSKSQYMLAMMYRDGFGVEKDDEKADEWFSAYLYSMASFTLLDVSYRTQNSGITTGEDESELLKASMKGYNERATTQVLSDRLLNRKKGDGEELLEDCKRYCTTGKNFGLLGKCYLEGISTESDEKEAFRLYSIAANAGDAESMYILANMYKIGIGTEKDLDQYHRWVRQAARHGQLNASMIISERDKVLNSKLKRAAAKNKSGKK